MWPTMAYVAAIQPTHSVSFLVIALAIAESLLLVCTDATRITATLTTKFVSYALYSFSHYCISTETWLVV